MIHSIWDILLLFGIILMIIAVGFILGVMSSKHTQDFPLTLCVAWMFSSIGFGGCFYMVLELLEVI